MNRLDEIKDLLETEALRQGTNGDFTLDVVRCVCSELREAGMDADQMRVLLRQALRDLKAG